MKNNTGKSEDNAKVEEYEKLRNFKNKEKFKLKIFNFGWWRNPPYKKADSRHCIELS